MTRSLTAAEFRAMAGKPKRLRAMFLAAAMSAVVASPAAAASSRAPLAFGSFCERNPDDCEATGKQGPMILTGHRWTELLTINRSVNRSIRYRADGGDVWSVIENGGAGDCEDYALTKRRKLLQRGWPSSALLVTVVRTRTGQGHAVLTVRTNEGDFVLDNLTWSVRRVERTGYRFYSMQSQHDPRKWVRA